MGIRADDMGAGPSSCQMQENFRDFWVRATKAQLERIDEDYYNRGKHRHGNPWTRNTALRRQKICYDESLTDARSTIL